MIKINLLPKKVSKKKMGLLQHLIAASGLLLLVLVAIGYFWVSLNGKISDLHGQVTAAKAEKERLKDVHTQKTAYETNIEKLKNQLDIITQIKEKRFMPVRLFDELTKVLNRDMPVWLNSMSFNEGKVTLDGYSLSNRDLAAFVTKLEATPFYRDVELLYSTKEKVEDREIFHFSLNAVPQTEDAEPVAQSGE